MATIKDVAKASGYGIATVSYALNDHPKIPENTKKKILEIAKQLNYVPNASARTLKTKKSYKVGIFVPGFKGNVHPTILAGITSVFKNDRSKYKMLVTIVDPEFLLVYEKQIDLALIIGGHVEKERIIDISKHIPVVLVDNQIQYNNVYNTYIDNYNGIIKRVKDFYKKGANRFIYISGTKNSNHNTERLEGFKQGIKDCNLKIEDQVILEANAFDSNRGHQVMKDFLNGNKMDYNALICANDELAFGAIEALKEANYSVPNDILVSGFDNIDKCNYHVPTLSTINVDWYHYGITLGQMMLDILEDRTVEKEIYISSELVDRESGEKLQ